MNFFTVLLGIWLLSKADALKCYECSTSNPEGCIGNEVDCPENYQCASVFSKGGSPSQKTQAKACFLPELCGEFSSNFGEENTLSISKCCNSDLCNTAPVPEPSEPVPNGLKCYGCVGDDCNRTVNCEGIQDHCSTLTASLVIVKKTTKGCASKNVCTFANIGKWGVGVKTTCCKGNFCNGATTAAATASLFVGPLVFFVLFS
ncbi:hypothetical protein OJAV_G00157750 [Oryzias javanicus]|uniref:UPAR/Ly6 domain-containing protein n=1 Tax=Oryzias javanicus TaxID=123683 RepID=A0A437CIK1_ORYJA|nr:hypothetical protein OJAV_G00157750 [Oryzias javanicus]